jgi:hypothetical protein
MGEEGRLGGGDDWRAVRGPSGGGGGRARSVRGRSTATGEEEEGGGVVSERLKTAVRVA